LERTAYRQCSGKQRKSRARFCRGRGREIATGTFAVIVFRPRKGGEGFKYTVPMSHMAKLGQINRTIQDPLARYDAVMGIGDLFVVGGGAFRRINPKAFHRRAVRLPSGGPSLFCGRFSPVVRAPESLTILPRRQGRGMLLAAHQTHRGCTRNRTRCAPTCDEIVQLLNRHDNSLYAHRPEPLLRRPSPTDCNS
jgi:hypothetical protein